MNIYLAIGVSKVLELKVFLGELAEVTHKCKLASMIVKLPDLNNIFQNISENNAMTDWSAREVIYLKNK